MKHQLNKYRSKSRRLKTWNYANTGWYYITICTKDKKNYFGEIRNNKGMLSNVGEIALKYFEEIPDHFENADIDDFIIMPNHIHGIIIIESVEIRHGVSLQEKQKFGKLQKHSLSIIVNHYKGSVTRWCRKNGVKEFSWQPNYYDHIIRNQDDLYRIRSYIKYNPLKWKEDKNYFPEN